MIRPQWVQVDHELIESAKDLAVILEDDEYRLLGGLVRFIEWALARVPDGALPSEHAVVKGGSAAKLIASAMGYRGDPQRLVEACAEVSHPILEAVPGGFRIRGLGRYDALVEAAKARTERAKQAAEARWSKSRESTSAFSPSSDAHGSADAMLEHRPSIAQPVLGDAEKQIKNQKQIQIQKQQHAAAPHSLPLDDETVPEALQQLWNGYPTLPRWRDLTKNRRRQATARIRERPSLREWRLIIARIAASSFCTGASRTGWRADPDWLLKPDTATKVLEGKYDDPGTSSAIGEVGEPPGTESPPELQLPDTAAGKLWGEIWALLQDEGKLYALQWLQQLHPIALVDGELELGCPDSCFLDWMRDHYLALIHEKCQRVGGVSVRLTDMKARAA
jgi:hypothetical protein